MKYCLKCRKSFNGCGDFGSNLAFCDISLVKFDWYLFRIESI